MPPDPPPPPHEVSPAPSCTEPKDACKRVLQRWWGWPGLAGIGSHGVAVDMPGRCAAVGVTPRNTRHHEAGP